jgi:hypothetical protein
VEQLAFGDEPAPIPDAVLLDGAHDHIGRP